MRCVFVRVCVSKYVAPWDHSGTSHQPPQGRIRPSAHPTHQSHLEDTHSQEQYGGALQTVFDLLSSSQQHAGC